MQCLNGESIVILGGKPYGKSKYTVRVFEDCWRNGTVLTIEMKQAVEKGRITQSEYDQITAMERMTRILIKYKGVFRMQEMTKEQLQEQPQIESYKSVSLQQELDQKNRELAEYKALYTFTAKKLDELAQQLNEGQSDQDNVSEPESTPVNA